MILKGNQRANGRELALHLMNVDDNEHAVVHELRGFLADDLIGAFKESEAISLGTKCQQYLFSLSLNPPQSANVSVEEFERVIGEIECRMGLMGQPRAIVFHEKKGRRHAHCVWSRINVNQMRAINLPHYKLRLRDISQELYLEHGWEMPAGLRDNQDRDPHNYTAEQAGQAKRVKREPAKIKAILKACWDASDSRMAFENALWEQGYCLARGDRRGFVAVDAQGEAYSLSRWLGVKTKDLRARLGDPSDLLTIEAALARLLGQSNEYSQCTAHEQSREDYYAKVANLVARQRKDRTKLAQRLEHRRIAELKARQDRLPKGLKAAWARLTGQYQRLCDELAEEAQSCATRDQQERQAQIDQHLAERRALAREWAFSQAQYAFEQEFRDQTARHSEQKYQPDPNQPLILPREAIAFTPDELKRQPDLILAHLSQKQAHFSRNDILRALAEFISDPVQLRAASDMALASKDLLKVPGNQADAFTTCEYDAIAQELRQRANELAQCGGFRVQSQHADAAIKQQNKELQHRVGANLSDEQVDAIRHILSPNQLCAVVGLAGTGKSTLLATARDAWERQGLRVRGAALAGKAADSLQSASGIPSRTLASLEASWKSGYEPVGCGDVVVIDEAGMVGTRQLARVSEQLQQRGCKLVLVGDPHQLQPIEAGTPFRDIEEIIGASRLTEIRRQQTEWQRRASRDLAEGRIIEAMTAYADRGCVHDAGDRDEAIAKLVDDYVADCQANGNSVSRLALAHRRKDVHAINQAIRVARKGLGQGTEETLFKTDQGPRAFARNDRILFTRNDATLGVRNGMLGTIEGVADSKLTVRLDAQDGEILTFSPVEFTSFDHGFAVSIHRSQGCTVDKSFVLSGRTMDENLAYVALTRHKNEARYYSAPDTASQALQVASQISRDKDARFSRPTR